MPSITFIEHTGERRTVEASLGDSVMQAATDNMVEGIVAECGGSCSCGTCHCFVDAEWQAKMPPMSDQEKETIECAVEAEETSRLACQIVLTEELDGLVVKLPEDQL